MNVVALLVVCEMAATSLRRHEMLTRGYFLIGSSVLLLLTVTGFATLPGRGTLQRVSDGRLSRWH